MINSKDYYEGDLDGFEIWLKDFDTEEKDKMIKMVDLLGIKENIDKDIKQNIDEIGQLNREIDELQKKLKPLRKQYGELVDNVLPMLNKLGKEQVRTKNYIFKILRKGHWKSSYRYKEGFNTALDKVNKNMKRILEQILDDTKKMVKVSPSFQVKPVEISEGFTDWIKKYTRKVLKKIIPRLKLVVVGNKELRKLI